MIEPQNLIPGAELKPGEPRLTTIAVRELDPDEDSRDRFAVLAVTEGVEYVVWTVNAMATVAGTYVRFGKELFANDVESAFLRALGDWLARL
jgi:transcriptional accessory protein Tex/SPT6